MREARSISYILQSYFMYIKNIDVGQKTQCYVIKSAPWTILWFRIFGIFSVENINRLGAMMFQTLDNSQLCVDLQYSSQHLLIV